MNKSNLALPDSVSSQQDVSSLLLEVKTYARWLAHSSILHRVSTRKKAPSPPVLSPAATELLHHAEASKPLTSRTLEGLVSELELIRRSASSVTITLAAPATADIKASLVGWCRQNISSTILVTFQFNSTLLGGMVVRYGSHIFDWSFRRQILAARNSFPEVLRRV